jgi:hypothetical protein
MLIDRAIKSAVTWFMLDKDMALESITMQDSTMLIATAQRALW